MPKSRRVTLILDTNMPYHRKIVRGVVAYARQAGNWSLYAEEDPLEKLPDFRAWQGHGIIAFIADQKVARAVRAGGLPTVAVEGGYGWYDPKDRIPYYATDNAAVARMAADHLIGQGFQRLAYCGVPRNRFTVWSDIRAKAFQQRAKEAGLPCSLYAAKHLSTRNWHELQRSLAQWLRSLEKPVGVMAANDARARHVLEACRAIGARVPDDVAVIGVDNDELMCELTDPPLTSVEQGARTVGYRAAELLDRLMAGRKAPQIANYVLPERVVVRRSTDTLAIEDADVAAAVRFIREHAGQRVRMEDLVQAVGVSRSTLGARFRKILRKTIHEEVQSVMIGRAQQLILADELPLKQVATEAGFAHVQHLTNLFRKHLGQTPGEFRKAIRLRPKS